MLNNKLQFKTLLTNTTLLYKYQLLQSCIKKNTQINSFLKNYIDFTKTNNIYFNKNKFLTALYQCVLLLQKIKQNNLKILFINPLKITNLKNKQLNNFLLKFIENTKMYFYTGSWVNGFITGNLFLKTSIETNFKKKNIKFFCPTKPHFAFLILTEENTNIIKELTDAGIPIIGLGINNLSDPRISYFIPTNLENNNQIIFWLKFFQNYL